MDFWRLTRRVTRSDLTRSGRDQAGEVPRTRPFPGFEPVRVHVLPQQGHLLVAPRGEMFGFPDDPVRIPGALTSARVRHDAERAEVVTAAHDRDPGVDPLGSLRHDVVIGLVL